MIVKRLVFIYPKIEMYQFKFGFYKIDILLIFPLFIDELDVN